MENICFSGGGLKGYAYIGVLKYLEETKALKDIKCISSTSIGSIFSILILAGYSSKELESIVHNIDFKYLENVDVNNLFVDYGLDDMKRVCVLMTVFLKKKNIDPDITLAEFYNLTNKTLHISCTNLDDYCQKVFNHIETPEVKVIEACRYSCCIPLIFTVNKSNMYIDGCFSRNLPIELLPVKNTVGFCFDTIKPKSKAGDFKSYVLKLVGCMLNRSNSLEKSLYISKGYKIISIPCYINALDINSTKEDIDKQILSGYLSIFKDNSTI